jgi:hypothetical protein
MMWRGSVRRLLTVAGIALAGLVAGPCVVRAATTTIAAESYGYDHSATFAQSATESSVVETGSSASGGTRPAELRAQPRVGIRAGVAAEGVALRSSSELGGVEPASQELLDAVAAHGRTVSIAQPGSDELRYLNAMRAEANVGGPNMTDILLRENPSKAAVLEEFLHGTQARLGIIDRLGVSGAEWHVKDFMIRFRGVLGLGDEDVQVLQQLRDLGL